MKNLESTGGLIFFGASCCWTWRRRGCLREDAYKLVQGHAMRAWKEDLVFKNEVAKEPEITNPP